MMVKKQIRTKNQIKALLSFYGIYSTEIIGKAYWSKRYLNWLESIRFNQESGNITLKVLLDEYNHYRSTILELTRKIRLMSQKEPYKGDVNNLITIPGISILTAMNLLTEIININRFNKFDQLNSYIGFVPGEYSSSESEIKTGILHRGNSILRRILIESSWMAIRKDPALLQCFNLYCKRMCKNKAIIKIARKLVSRIRYVLIRKQPYVIGVIG